MLFVLKALLSGVIVAIVSEVAKRSSVLGGFIASLPLISILAFIWLYLDTKSFEKIGTLSYSILWLVLPSLSLFIALPWLLKKMGNFWLGLGGALAVMAVFYFITVAVLRRFDVEF